MEERGGRTFRGIIVRGEGITRRGKKDKLQKGSGENTRKDATRPKKKNFWCLKGKSLARERRGLAIPAHAVVQPPWPDKKGKGTSIAIYVPRKTPPLAVRSPTKKEMEKGLGGGGGGGGGGGCVGLGGGGGGGFLGGGGGGGGDATTEKKRSYAQRGKKNPFVRGQNGRQRIHSTSESTFLTHVASMEKKREKAFLTGKRKKKGGRLHFKRRWGGEKGFFFRSAEKKKKGLGKEIEKRSEGRCL